MPSGIDVSNHPNSLFEPEALTKGDPLKSLHFCSVNSRSRSKFLKVLCCSLVALLWLAGCGSVDEVSTAEAAATQSDEQAESAEDDEYGDDEHGDEDHGDDEHGDEEHDDHDEDASGGLGAHVHGFAELNVAWSGSTAVVDLISPADNIFGFEYEPETDEDKALAAERTDTLATPGIIGFNDEAGCQLTDDVETEVEFEGTHAEVNAAWLFDCDNPAEITSLDLSELFASFPAMVDVDASWASDEKQSSAELTPSSSVLRFE